jgi:hypothetical protein
MCYRKIHPSLVAHDFLNIDKNNCPCEILWKIHFEGEENVQIVAIITAF